VELLSGYYKKALETITKGAVLSVEAGNARYNANAVAIVMKGFTPVIQALWGTF
jgi:hypothetical protein